jgi:hypothetical protein
MIDFLPTIESLSSQVRHALAALPHDVDEAAQRMQVVAAELERTRRQGEAEAEAEAEAMGRAYAA